MDVVEIKVYPFRRSRRSRTLYVVLAHYLAFGVVPLLLPDPFQDIEVPTQGWKTQNGLDRELIKPSGSGCAATCSTLSRAAAGQSIAYFGPDIRSPVPQPALNMNMDAHTTSSR